MSTVLNLKLAVIVVLGLAASCCGQSSEWSASEYHATVDVAADGSAVVLERWEVTCAERSPGRDFHGFCRTLPVEAPGPLGSRHRVFLKVVRVADEQSRPLPHSVRTWRDQFELKIPLEPQPGATRTLQVSYFIRNLVRPYPDHDEVYWDLTGGGITSPIERASAEVMLPAEAAGAIRSQAFVMGPSGGPLLPQIHGATVQFQSWHALRPGARLVVDVFVPKGVFRMPSWATRAEWFIEANPVVLLPAVVLFLMLAIRALKGGAPAVVAIAYGPPAGLTPAEAGMLLDDSFDPRDVTATLVDLAVRGYLRIEEDRDALAGHPDYVLRLLRGREDWHTLALHEQTMIFNIFYGGQWTKLSSLRLRFAVALPAMRSAVLNALLDKGMYRVEPRAIHVYRVAAVALVAGLFALAQVSGVVAVFQSGLLAVAAFIASAALVYWFGRHLTAKTLRGARTAAQIEGFREFLSRVDADRLERLPAGAFQQYLPYAMALGVEHRWAGTLAGIGRELPEWYQVAGGDGFDARLWAHSVDAMSRQASGVFASVPRTGRLFGAHSHASEPTTAASPR